MPESTGATLEAAPAAEAPSSPRRASDPARPPEEPRRAVQWLSGLAPLVLLGLLLLALFRWGPLGLLRTSFPPVEELTIERVWLPEEGEMRIRVVNGGPEPVTVSQVLVDDALWSFGMDGDPTIGRLESRVLTVPYPWVEGEPHEIALLTSTGLTFEGGVEVATRAPSVDARYLGAFGLIGIYVGVLPVLLGLLWLPFLRGLSRAWVDFFLAFTVGLLVFLGGDALVEAAETAVHVPGAFQGPGIVLLGLVGTPLLLSVVAGRRGGDSARALAVLVAVAIGVHNLGEGLAIGAAYAAGAVALGSFLVVGFLVHNTTEGLAIVAPLSRERVPLALLVGLGLVAGVPTILGTWLGGFGYSPVWTTLFLAIGAGAVVEVVLKIAGMFRRRRDTALTAPLNAAGLLLGLVLMYATGLLVTG